MDLKSIINNTEAVDRSMQRQTTPITPVQTVQPPHSFREYSHQPPAASSKHPSHDYGVRGPEPFASPTEYHRAYQRPSAPTPLQTPSQQDPRSPAGNSQYSAQSPYSRQSIGASQYPFPHNLSPRSPAQGQPHPNSLQRLDGYPQPQPLPPHLQHHSNPYGQSPAPQMPATPISGNPYSQHQRSQSLHSHSTSTPTSAHSQNQQYSQFPQDSPVSAGSFQHTHLPQHQRQPSQPERQLSQPGTPLGPPLSNPRPPSGGFPQPQSPYQQRPPSSGAVNQQFINPQNSTPPSQQPHNPVPSETPSHNNSRPVSTAESSVPQSLRERSMSVSPKTQLPGLPRAEVRKIEPKPTENGYTATPKRKIEDRDGSEPVSTAQMANGTPSTQSRTISPQQPSRKRVRYNEPPIWARSFTGRVKDTSALLGVKRPINIKLEHSAQPPNGHQVDTAPVNKPTQIAQPDFQGQLPLGAWEPSLTGIRPYEEVSKRVADWLFTQVVSRPDVGELASRGVEIEIEAKLGQLIDKGTNERYLLPVVSECVLAETGKVAFKSSVTEANHKELNDFLNAQVEETHPENPRRTKQRVQVVYAHRRERDKFYELPPSHYATLPACMRSALNARQTVKVRVTYDQKTGQVLAKIIKARVDSMDVFNPSFPLDCRISINLEMKYDGELEELIALSQNSRIPDRNKDRLSYTQSHYQIDLTQVTTVTDTGVVTEKEHELEIEVSAAAVREQGRLAQSREPNQYGELIEGLMDNVRVLARRKT